MAIRKVEAQVAGSVLTHSVGVGQHITQGTTIIILECMKMEIPHEAPCAGAVVWLEACAKTVEVGDVVATLDDAPAPSRP
jgi:biotin carboxyl carrier protein